MHVPMILLHLYKQYKLCWLSPVETKPGFGTNGIRVSRWNLTLMYLDKDFAHAKSGKCWLWGSSVIFGAVSAALYVLIHVAVFVVVHLHATADWFGQVVGFVHQKICERNMLNIWKSVRGKGFWRSFSRLFSMENR